MINFEENLKASGTYSLIALVHNGEFQAAIYRPYPIVAGEIKFEVPEVWRVQESLKFNGSVVKSTTTSILINSKTEQIIKLEVDDIKVALWIAKRLNVAELFIPEKEVG